MNIRFRYKEIGYVAYPAGFVHPMS